MIQSTWKSNYRRYIMEEKFKAYLVQAFRTIAPTQAAMEFRKQTLKAMLDRAQELRIKGMTDEDLIFDTVMEDYEDFGDKLKEFEAREIKTNAAKRHVSFGAILAVSVVALLAITYVIVGVTTHVWHPTWLMLVGGIFVGIGVILALVGVKAVAKKKYGILRLLVVPAEVLLSVFTFLLLQIVFHLTGSWMTFLAMVALIVGVDTVIAFFTDSRIKWIELPVFVTVFTIMLFVVLGILLPTFWHPGWILCLVGPIAALVEIIVFASIRNGKKDKAEKAKANEKFVKTDDKYWEEW